MIQSRKVWKLRKINEIPLLWSLWILTCAFVTTTTSGQEPFATLPQGRIAGIKVFTKNSLTPVEIYFGIPYAVAPTGKYRFSAPERHPGWRRTLFAHRRAPRCPHPGDAATDYVSEDCLFLNVWTPRRADGNTLPVVVIFYSESWSRAAATNLPCEDLAAEGLVVVTVSYRLHFLAFFTLLSVAARGNLAILDQYLALLWVRENIAVFGGDPTSITLLGHSAGADSILYHIASQRSLGLFHRAIVMSPLEIWNAIDEKNVVQIQLAMEKASRNFAKQLQCSAASDTELLQCLRSRSLDDILKIYSMSNDTHGILPIADNFLPESEQYLPKSLSDALSATSQPSMQLDLLLGTADLEAFNANHDFYGELTKLGKEGILEYATSRVIPELLRKFSIPFPPPPMLVEAVRWEYWGASGKELRGEVDPSSSPGSAAAAAAAAERLLRAESSARWGAGAALLAAGLARRHRLARLYVYRYSQSGGVDLHGTHLNVTGAVHGTDLVALLGDSLMVQVARRQPTSSEQQASNVLRRYFVNFIKYGSPTSDGEWPRHRAGDPHVHNLRENEGACDVYASSKDVAFWLQYLPYLYRILTADDTEKLPLEQGESRLRGGVYGLCGVSALLLVLLLASAALLRWERRRTALHFDDDSPHSHN